MYEIETERRTVKEDLIELSKVKYGLFNVDEWKAIVAGIIAKKIEQMDLEEANYDKMREDIAAFLNKLIDGLEERYYNERPATFKGVLQGGVAALTDVFGQMRKDVPEFTDEIVNFLENPDSRRAIKSFLENQLNEYVDQTFADRDYSSRNRILRRYHMEYVGDTMVMLHDREQELKTSLRPYTAGIFGAALLLVILLLLPAQPSKTDFSLAVISCLSLLIVGLLLPMIEIDARILEMKFVLLGENIQFTDQVLFFKSKSILEIVQLMLQQGEFDLLAVGILVLLFSVIFPISKLFASLAVVYNPGLTKTRFIDFLAFRTGKWSMADVMVVAIFMAYIGFSGIVTEQLRQLERISRSIDVMTTNESSLEVGFYLFTSFVIASIFLAQRLHRNIRDTNALSNPTTFNPSAPNS